MSENPTESPVDENKLIAERCAKLDKLRGAGANGFPNDFRRDALADQLLTAYGDREPAWFEQNTVRVKVGGRMMIKRVMGKASFAKIADRTGEIQLFVQSAALGEAQRLTPQTGMFVMFPSWLSHGVRPYRGTRERISVAINFSLG